MALVLALLLLPAAPLRCESGLRLDAGSRQAWQPMPHWLGNASGQASVSVADGALDFAVPEPGRGMKWRISFEPTDVFFYRWLVAIRGPPYRYPAQNAGTEAGFLPPPAGRVMERAPLSRGADAHGPRFVAHVAGDRVSH
jgi:hypothetical protein